MRIVAGSARGRRLVTPPGTGVRPTTDRVREAVFNSLGSLDALHDAHVLDLFAGSGALGLEALSRGARSAVFVDADGAALDAVRANVRACGLDAVATVVRSPAVAALERMGDRPFDLVLVDPPYAYEEWPELLDLLGRPGVLAEDAIVVIESDRAVALPESWTEIRQRSYGRTVVVIARGGAAGVTSDPPDPAS